METYEFPKGWTRCSECYGYGLVQNGLDIIDCPNCYGGCMERMRDARGRYTS